MCVCFKANSSWERSGASIFCFSDCFSIIVSKNESASSDVFGFGGGLGVFWISGLFR